MLLLSLHSTARSDFVIVTSLWCARKLSPWVMLCHHRDGRATWFNDWHVSATTIIDCVRAFMPVCVKATGSSFMSWIHLMPSGVRICFCQGSMSLHLVSVSRKPDCQSMEKRDEIEYQGQCCQMQNTGEDSGCWCATSIIAAIFQS